MAKKSVTRCGWVTNDPIYIAYHDEEWGEQVGLGARAAKPTSGLARQSKNTFSSVDVPTGMPPSEKTIFESAEANPDLELSAQETSHDDKKHFEFLVLEGAQAGLSWLTVLKRREGYRTAFAGFNPDKVAQFTEVDVERLVQDASIIRNRQKIKSAINNASVFLEIQEEFGSFDEYIWAFVGGEPKVNNWQTDEQIPATSIESDYLSKDLKKRGMSFVGSTIMYAHMQACGLVNDHILNCFKRK